MKYSELMKYYDYKISNIVRAVRVGRVSVMSWRKNDKIPFKYQCIFEVISNGELKANREDNDLYNMKT